MHQLINTGDESLKLLWVYSPSGPEEEYIDILKEIKQKLTKLI